MGLKKNQPRPRQWGSKRVSEEEVRDLYSRWLDGEPAHVLAEERGCGHNTSILGLFRRHGYPTKVARTCALNDCDVEFETCQPRRLYCCRKHAKLAGSRKDRGVMAVEVECALPECRTMLWITAHRGERPRHRFCCKEHGDLHHRRAQSGFYDRVLQRSPSSCEVCGEQFVLDEHHEEFSAVRGAVRSNKDSKIHVLCPTHHLAIHRGLAEYREGRWVSLVDDIREGLERGTDTFSNYRVGCTWDVVH